MGYYRTRSPIEGYYRPTRGDMPGTWNVFPFDAAPILNVSFDDLPVVVRAWLIGRPEVPVRALLL